MSDDKSPGVDPRFDPAFQRGFDGTVPVAPAEPRVRKSALAKAAPPATPAPERTTLPERTAVPELVEGPPPGRPEVQPKLAVREPRRVAETVPEAHEGLEGHHDDPSPEDHEESAPSRNPYLLFLGIIAVALFATGIWLFVRSGAEFNSKVVQSQGDYMSLTATIYAAPFIAMLGAMTAIGVLFVFALRWRGRRPR